MISLYRSLSLCLSLSLSSTWMMQTGKKKMEMYNDIIISYIYSPFLKKIKYLI